MTLRIDCINKNIQHDVINYWKVQDSKKGTVDGVTSNHNTIWYMYCSRVCDFEFWLHITSPIVHFKNF